MLSSKARKLLFLECGLLSILLTLLLTFTFSRSYTLHFEQVTLNVYTNGTSDFTTNVTSLVRSLGAMAVFSLIFGVATGAAIGLTCSPRANKLSAASGPRAYEEEMTRAGFVVINKTVEGTTYTLTELGRRFLRDYWFLEKTDGASIPTHSSVEARTQEAQ